MKKSPRGMLSGEEASVFCEQVALVVSSGIPLQDGVEALCENYRGTRFQEPFSELDRHLKETGSLFEAAREVGVFPHYLVQMLKIGESTGELDNVCRGLADYYDREAKIRRAVRNAVTYPLVLIVMMACVIALLIVKVLPIFEQVLGSMGSDLGASATSMMNLGMGAGRAVLIAAGAVILIALATLLLLRTPLRERVMRVIWKLFPPIKRISRRMAAGRFASVMAMMLSSGFPLGDAMGILPDIFEDEDAKKSVFACREKIASGESFADAVAETGFFDELHNRMIHVGVTAGQSDVVMRRLSEIYEEEMDGDIARLVSMIEPTLVALLSIVIGAILLSVMLPLAGIMTSIG